MRVALISKEAKPENPFYLMGYVGPTRQQPAAGIHDMPQINTVLLEINKQLYLISTGDFISFSKDKSDEIKASLEKEAGIPYENCSLVALHTHSGPEGTSSGSLGTMRVNDGYFQKVKQLIVDSALEGKARLKEAKAVICVIPIEGCFSNRNDPGAPYDNEVTVIQFKDSGDQNLGAILNIPCHSTVLGPTNNQASADLLGAVRNKLSEALGVPVMACMGAAGDASNRQHRQGDDFQELERVSSELFAQIQAFQDYRPLNLEPAAIKPLSYTIDYDNTQYYAEYRRLLAETKAMLQSPDISPVQYKLSASSVSQLEKKLGVAHVHKEVRSKIYAFGDLQIVAFGGELSSKLGLRMKNKNPRKQTMVITCVDDHGGYFIEEAQYGKYYETIATDNPKGAPEKITQQIEDEL